MYVSDLEMQVRRELEVSRAKFFGRIQGLIAGVVIATVVISLW